MIDWIKDLSEGADAPWRSVNYTKINTFGQEISARIDFPTMLVRDDFFIRTLELSYSHINNRVGVNHS
jgi:iron complex outermembrane receptor protein